MAFGFLAWRLSLRTECLIIVLPGFNKQAEDEYNRSAILALIKFNPGFSMRNQVPVSPKRLGPVEPKFHPEIYTRTIF